MLTMTRRNLGLASGMAAAVALSAAALIAFSADAAPAAEPGTAAPDFTGTTSTGETVSLSDYEGKTVVLEWTNDGCPFVKKHYAEPPMNMQTLQTEDAAGDDVVWLQIISSKPGSQGHVSGAEADAINDGRDAAPDHVILDPSGDIGRLYDAKTTPHMYVVNPAGTLVYMGGIDDKNSADPASLKGATNFVVAALDDLKAGRAVARPVSAPYGCSVKY